MQPLSLNHTPASKYILWFLLKLEFSLIMSFMDFSWDTGNFIGCLLRDQICLPQYLTLLILERKRVGRELNIYPTGKEFCQGSAKILVIISFLSNTGSFIVKTITFQLVNWISQRNIIHALSYGHCICNWKFHVYIGCLNGY